jgi:maltose O-acetyltransferase
MSEIIYDTNINLPQQQFIFKIAATFPFLLIFRFTRYLITSKMPNVKNSRVTPGFSAILGKYIYADDVYLNDTIFLDYAPIKIGKGTVFSGKNALITSTHDFFNFNIVEAKPISIGENVWITRSCIILGGVTIGNNSVIGPGSVVTCDIPENTYSAGNPCKVIRKIKR